MITVGMFPTIVPQITCTIEKINNANSIRYSSNCCLDSCFCRKIITSKSTITNTKYNQLSKLSTNMNNPPIKKLHTKYRKNFQQYTY